ncbi:MAG: NAD(P)/FAD-dependent oxidoreductase [Solirubrobacteraceae bacterium]
MQHETSSPDLDEPEARASEHNPAEAPTLVIGGGPAGLTAAYLLAQAGRPVTLLEANVRVGGLAQTVEVDGYRFDLGGHRFFTKNREVDDLWHEIMGDEFLRRPRQSRIFWNGKFLDYPLNGMDVIRKLGPVELTRSAASYLRAALTPRRGPETTFEQWVSNRFGKRLYKLFFESYTEKVWGVPTSEIRAEWAAQRIKNLNFFRAARDAFFGDKNQSVTSLIKEFNYPRYGPGQMWEKMTERIRELGGQVLLETAVEAIEVEDDRVVGVVVDGERWPVGGQVVSSLPLRTMVRFCGEGAPQNVREAAEAVRYRDFLTVALVIDAADPFTDNWIYIHEPSVQVGRIQNYKSWSPWMVPDQSKACVGLEYFCFEGEKLWMMSDDELVALATQELGALGLADPADVERGFAVRVPKAYPMYDPDYAPRVDAIRQWTNKIENLQQVGRNGLHRYNNSDHSMLTAMRAVDNILKDAGHDVWEVNIESAYLEESEVEEHPYVRVPDVAGGTG